MRLGDLLRWSLQSSRLREVALRDELAALETYLEIQSLKDFRSWGCITDTFYVRAIMAEQAQLYFLQLRYLGAG